MGPRGLLVDSVLKYISWKYTGMEGFTAPASSVGLIGVIGITLVKNLRNNVIIISVIDTVSTVTMTWAHPTPAKSTTTRTFLIFPCCIVTRSQGQRIARVRVPKLIAATSSVFSPILGL